MTNASKRLPWNTTLSVLLSRGVGVTWALIMAWLFVVAARDHHPVFSSRHECGTDPADILRAGELLEASTLRFVIAAHCSNARYLPDERIALRYGGAPVEVETRKFSIAGAVHYKIVSVGGEAAEP
ncbi:MAG TPA: hypothetical protein VIK58_01885 [Caldimonas sp.]